MLKQSPKVSIIGAGVVGSTLANALFSKGYKFVSIIDQNGSLALSLAKTVKCNKAGVVISDIALSSDIVFLTVNDQAISRVAVELSKQKKFNFKKMLFIHCSGVYSADILEPLRKKGATVASMHPVQTFPIYKNNTRTKIKLKGIYYGIDGLPNAISPVQKIVEDLDGKSIVIPKEYKPLYHIACVFASSYFITLLNTISELCQKMKLKASWMEVFGPLMTSSMENVIRTSVPKALTGPIVRGDLETIDLHLNTLVQYAPQFLSTYTIGGIEVARIAKENGRLSQENFNKIISKFNTFIKRTSFEKITRVKK